VDTKDLPVAPQVITLNIDKANVEIQLQNHTDAWLDIQSDIRGFGLPTNKAQTSATVVTEPVAHIDYQLIHKGVYSELNSVVKVKLAAPSLQRLVVQLEQGDITVYQEGNVGHLPQLDLSTAEGQVINPANKP
jgi:hypothetical protein